MNLEIIFTNKLLHECPNCTTFIAGQDYCPSCTARIEASLEASIREVYAPYTRESVCSDIQAIRRSDSSLRYLLKEFLALIMGALFFYALSFL